MQNQRTNPKKLEERELTPVEQRLIEYYFETDNQTESYRLAYNADGYSKAALEVQACRKFAETHIQAEIGKLLAVGAARSGLSRESRIRDMRAFAKRCEDSGNLGAALGAHVEANKLAGLHKETIELQVNDLRDELNELAKISPELAEAFAKEKGITQH